jgi:hypothetical protein
LSGAAVQSASSIYPRRPHVDARRDDLQVEAPSSMVIDAAAWLVLVPIVVLGLAVWRAKA